MKKVMKQHLVKHINIIYKVLLISIYIIIYSLNQFFKNTKNFQLEIYSPTIPQAGTYTTEVEWTHLATSIFFIILIRQMFRWYV